MRKYKITFKKNICSAPDPKIVKLYVSLKLAF